MKGESMHSKSSASPSGHKASSAAKSVKNKSATGKRVVGKAPLLTAENNADLHLLVQEAIQEIESGKSEPWL